MFDLIVRGGTVVTPERSDLLDVAVQGEQIAALAMPGAIAPESARRVVDARGCYVMPGGVDAHCHYSLPFAGAFSEGPEYSYAAALGGTTTVCDFVFHESFATPFLTVHEAIEQKRALNERKIAVDWGLHVMLGGNPSFETIEEIGDVIRAGMPTIKTMTTYGWMSDDGHRFGIMSEVARHGGMSIVHAEDDAVANWLTAKYVREGKTHGAYISETRNGFVEELAIRRCMALAEETGSALYVFHMAAAKGVRALAEARARGLPFYGETLLSYLCFTQDVLWDDEKHGLLWSNFPTLKHQADQDELWRALADGRMQTISSDHCGNTIEERYQKMGQTVERMQGGVTAVELRVPVAFHRGVQEGHISVNRFVEVVSANPAKVIGLWPRKGRLAPGADADIIVLDPNRTWTVGLEDLHMSSDYNCWEGWELRGKVRTTILRGQVIVKDEQFVGSRTGGRFQERRIEPGVLAPPQAAGLASEGVSGDRPDAALALR